MRNPQEPAGLVLIVEDNRNISEMIGEYLESRGFEVDYASDGLDGYRLASENTYDVIVLDLMLPRLDGIEVCKRLREEARKSTPVLMLTARDTLDEKLTGLSAGADDYLTKPFEFEELLARIRALTRRTEQPDSVWLKAGDLRIDLLSRRVWRGDKSIELSSREFALLEHFMRHRGQVLSRGQLLSAIWDYSFDTGSNVVSVYVTHLRRKIDRPGEPSLINTVRGAGYRFEPPGDF